jgi:long-subunit fatty acid transport protein
MKNKLMVATALCSLVAADVYGAGFEKSVMWSGREAGYAGAGQSRISGSQSIVFNPAGLAGSGNGDLSLNFSPTSLKMKGHLASVATEEETDHNFSPIGGATAGYKINEKLGFGVGAYVIAGNKAIYDGVDLTGDSANVTFRPRIATDFAVMEYAVGGAYEVMPGLRLGAAWRILKANGGLSTIKKVPPTTAYTYVNLVDLKDTKYNGFRLGAQYQAEDDSWGVGATFRNGVDFVAESGTNNGNVVVIASNTVTNATISNATVGTSLPAAFSLGGNYKLSNDFRLLADVDFVKYSENNQLAINATLTSALLGGGTPVALPNIPLKWKDMWNFRVGGEYTGMAGMALRAGYSLTTRVTPKADARATISPSGLGHLFSVGAGTNILGDNLALDGAFEYSFNSGEGAMSSTPAGSTTKELLADVTTKHKADVMALHLGATYKF